MCMFYAMRCTLYQVFNVYINIHVNCIVFLIWKCFVNCVEFMLLIVLHLLCVFCDLHSVRW